MLYTEYDRENYSRNPTVREVTQGKNTARINRENINTNP